MKNIVLVTGPNGSGLSSTEFVFEELGFYVIKNTPKEALNSVIDAALSSKIKNYCLMIPAFMARFAIELVKQRKDADYRIVILNCDQDELHKRYSLTRHVHPRSATFNVSNSEAIQCDIKDILDVVNLADYYIDTTSISVKQLRGRLYKYLVDAEEHNMTSVTFISFGIKNGIPQGIEVVSM